MDAWKLCYKLFYPKLDYEKVLAKPVAGAYTGNSNINKTVKKSKNSWTKAPNQKQSGRISRRKNSL